MTNRQPPTEEFAAFIGLDWADQKHDVVVRAADAEKGEHRQLEHSPEALDAWAAELRERFAGRPVALCFEQTRGPIAYALFTKKVLKMIDRPTQISA